MPTLLCDNTQDFRSTIREIEKNSMPDTTLGFRIRDASTGLDRLVFNRHVLPDPIEAMNESLDQTSGHLCIDGYAVQLGQNWDDEMLGNVLTTMSSFDAEPVVSYRPMTLARQRFVMSAITRVQAFRDHLVEQAGVNSYDDLVVIPNLIPSGFDFNTTEQENRVWRERLVAELRRNSLAAPPVGSSEEWIGGTTEVTEADWLNYAFCADEPDEWTEDNLFRVLVADGATRSPDMQTVSEYAAEHPGHNLNLLWV